MPETTPQQIGPLASVADLAARTGLPADDPDLAKELDAASWRFRDAVRRPISRVEHDTIVLDGGGRRNLRLPSAPVVAVHAVQIDGTDVAVQASANGLLRRADGRPWPDAYGAVTVEYTHGYDPVPGEVKEAVLDAAEGRLETLRGVQTLQVGGISQTFSKAEQSGVSEAWAATVARWRIRAGDRA